MGRPKKELKQVHRKKIKKAKKKLKSHLEGKTLYSSLTQRAKNFLRKSRKKRKNAV